MRRLLLFVLVPALASAPGPVRADLVTIALEGTSFSALGDSVILAPRTFSLDLTPGVPQTSRLQAAQFNVGDSGFANQTFAGTLSRMVTADGVTGVLSQPLSLSIMELMDTLTISPGPATVLDLGGLRRLEIAPLGTTASRDSGGPSPLDLLGTFRLTIVPEPSALVLSGLGLVGWLGYRCRRRS